MGLGDDITAAVRDVIDTPLSIRNGIVVPETENVALQNGAVKVDATYLYADLADSSRAAQVLYPHVTAAIIRAFVNAASRTLRYHNGQIRSFDGDRVMAIFIGNMKNTNAVRAGLGINWAVDRIVRPKVYEKWSDIPRYWEMRHGVGIATGEALIVRGGVRNNNDLISIGAAPNVAAKLSELRGIPTTYITQPVYDNADPPAKITNGQNMWMTFPAQTIGGKVYTVLGSTWQWGP